MLWLAFLDFACIVLLGFVVLGFLLFGFVVFARFCFVVFGCLTFICCGIECCTLLGCLFFDVHLLLLGVGVSSSYVLYFRFCVVFWFCGFLWVVVVCCSFGSCILEFGFVSLICVFLFCYWHLTGTCTFAFAVGLV